MPHSTMSPLPSKAKWLRHALEVEGFWLSVACQNELDPREQEIMKLKKTSEQQVDDIKMYELRLGQMNERMQDIEEELELKAGENNRLRN